MRIVHSPLKWNDSSVASDWQEIMLAAICSYSAKPSVCDASPKALLRPVFYV